MGLKLSLRFVLKNLHILQMCPSGCPLTHARAGSAWFPYFAFSDSSFQKPQAPHRSTVFSMSGCPWKTALQSFYHPKFYAYAHYLVSKQKQVMHCRQQSPVLWLHRARLGTYMSVWVIRFTIWTNSQSWTLPSRAPKGHSFHTRD